MSGGSYNYIYHSIMNLEQEIENQHINPRRAAFAKLMGLVGKAMKAIEWVDSADCAEGYEDESIDTVFSFLGEDAELVKKAAAYDAMADILKEYFKETK